MILWIKDIAYHKEQCQSSNRGDEHGGVSSQTAGNGRERKERKE